MLRRGKGKRRGRLVRSESSPNAGRQCSGGGGATGARTYSKRESMISLKRCTACPIGSMSAASSSLAASAYLAFALARAFATAFLRRSISSRSS